MSIVAASTRRYKVSANIDAATSYTLSFWMKTSSQGAAGDATLSNVGTDDFSQFYIDSGNLSIFGTGGNQGGSVTFTGMDFYAITWSVTTGAATPVLYLNGSAVTINGDAFPWSVSADPGSRLWFLCTPTASSRRMAGKWPTSSSPTPACSPPWKSPRRWPPNHRSSPPLAGGSAALI